MASVLLFVVPDEDAPRHADAVVVLAGSPAVRLPKGLELMRRHVAGVLVLSDGNAPGSPATHPYCAGKGSFGTICFHPRPYSTRGEARFVAQLARRRGWRRVVIVTSTYHVNRARMIFRRCVDGDVDAVGARPGLAEWAGGVAYEWVKLGYALTLARGC